MWKSSLLSVLIEVRSDSIGVVSVLDPSLVSVSLAFFYIYTFPMSSWDSFLKKWVTEEALKFFFLNVVESTGVPSYGLWGQ